MKRDKYIMLQNHITNSKKKKRKHAVFQNWKIFSDRRCGGCHNEAIANRKKPMPIAAKFSGIFSGDQDKAGPVSTIIHNNMHFADVPFFLKSLTFMESLLIRKIQVAMYVHSLKYGMLASKGHAVSIPHELKIATSLPLLASEVSILLLRSKNMSNKHYLVSRSAV